MTDGQKESIYLIYVNVCNALVYSDDMILDNTLSKTAKDIIRVIRDRLKWIKINMDLKATQDVSKVVDTLRYDGVLRLLASMPEENQGELEDLIVNYLKSIDNVQR